MHCTEHSTEHSTVHCTDYKVRCNAQRTTLYYTLTALRRVLCSALCTVLCTVPHTPPIVDAGRFPSSLRLANASLRLLFSHISVSSRIDPCLSRARFAGAGAFTRVSFAEASRMTLDIRRGGLRGSVGVPGGAPAEAAAGAITPAVGRTESADPCCYNSSTARAAASWLLPQLWSPTRRQFPEPMWIATPRIRSSCMVIGGSVLTLRVLG